jgi:hypothetical protein
MKTLVILLLGLTIVSFTACSNSGVAARLLHDRVRARKHHGQRHGKIALSLPGFSRNARGVKTGAAFADQP